MKKIPFIATFLALIASAFLFQSCKVDCKYLESLGKECKPTKRKPPPIKIETIPSKKDDKTSRNCEVCPHIDKATVTIWRNERVVCSGVLVKSKKRIRVLTALHCVLKRNKNVIPYGFVGIGKRVKYRFVVARINRTQDLALLRITDKITVPLTIAKTPKKFPEKGDTVWIVGSPRGIPHVISHGTVALDNTYSIHSPGFHCMLIDGSIFYGNSGGGVFDANGKLVGITSEFGPSFPDKGLWAYVVHPKEIIDFLAGKI